jgi:hypothetical protein
MHTSPKQARVSRIGATSVAWSHPYAEREKCVAQTRVMVVEQADVSHPSMQSPRTV